MSFEDVMDAWEERDEAERANLCSLVETCERILRCPSREGGGYEEIPTRLLLKLNNCLKPFRR